MNGNSINYGLVKKLNFVGQSKQVNLQWRQDTSQGTTHKGNLNKLRREGRRYLSKKESIFQKQN